MKSAWTRRRYLKALMGLTCVRLGAARAQPPLIALELKLQRDVDLPSTLGINACVMGKLSYGGTALSDPGTFVCDTLELPYRNELQEISCIKPGRYEGFIKTQPTSAGVDLGWRIELKGTTQKAIQIHPGNTTDDTRGCILVGMRQASACLLQGGTSKPARDKLRAIYGDSDLRPVFVTVMN